MSVQDVLARIAQIDTALTPAPVPAPASTSFSSVLGAQTAAVAPASATPAMSSTGFTAAPGAGVQAMLQAASAEVGQTEQPQGSNDSPRIAQYRSATAGGGIGPWCAYF